MPGLIGFMEFTFMRQRGDLSVERLARLMTEYLPERGPKGEAAKFFGSRHQLTCALVYEAQIPVSSRITAYEDARRLIRNSSFRAVTMCYCRHKKEHLGQSCRKDGYFLLVEARTGVLVNTPVCMSPPPRRAASWSRQ